jgi:excinuclease UvrABC helicase subunit UvrB
LAYLDEDGHKEAVEEIRQGIAEIEAFLEKIGQLGQLDDCPELLFLREWQSEVETSRPRSPRERLVAELQAAVEEDQFELAASLRDRLHLLETEQSGQEL